MDKKFLALFCTSLLAVSAVFAGEDLRINGDFRGARPGATLAPGWAVAPGAVTRLLPDRKRGRSILEVSSPVNGATVVVSDLIEVRGNSLYFKSELRGRGAASLGFEAFDVNRNRVIAADRRQFPVGSRFRDAKAVFDLRIPGIRYVRVSLTAEPGSVVNFRDVEGEFRVVPVAAPVAPPPPPAPVAPPPPAPVAPPPAPVAPPPVAPAPGVPAPTLTLVDDSFHWFRNLREVEVAHVVLPYGGDIDFKLEEHHHRRIEWRQVAGSPAVCRVRIRHERDFGPIRPASADIEIKGIAPGATLVEFNGGGKRFIVYVTVR